MKMSVQLHRDYYNFICHFGTLNEVVNKILEAAERGEIEIYDNKDTAPPATDASRYNVEITNKAYIQMVGLLGSRSPTISLRRILYWFVDNEIYTVLGMEYKQLLPTQTRTLKNMIIHVDTAIKHVLEYIDDCLKDGIDFEEQSQGIRYKFEQHRQQIKELYDGL